MPRQKQQPGEAGEPSGVNGDFGISPHSLSPKQNGSPVSVETLGSRGTSAAAAHIGGYDSESVRDLYTSERSPTTDTAMPGSSPLSDMLYFDDDNNDFDGTHVNGQVDTPTRPPAEAIEQLSESELPPTQPFTILREMEPMSQGPVAEPRADIERTEELELDDPWSISEHDSSNDDDRDESYYPSGTNDTSKKKQKKSSNRKTARKKPALGSIEAPAKSLPEPSIKGHTKAFARQNRVSQTGGAKGQPRSNMARRIYASRATQSGDQGALDANIPATQAVPATFPQHKSSTSRIPKKSFFGSDEILAEHSQDAVVDPKMKRSNPATGDKTSAGPQPSGKSVQTASSNENKVGAREDIPHVDIHSSEYFSQQAAAPTASSRKTALPKTRGTRTNSKKREGPKTTDDPALDANGHYENLDAPSATQAADPFEIEVSPEPDTRPTRSKARKVADTRGKKNKNPSEAVAPTFNINDAEAPNMKGVTGSNLKKKRSPVGYGSNSGRERVTRRSDPEHQQTGSGVVHFDHRPKSHSLPQQPTEDEQVGVGLSRQPGGSFVSKNIDDEFPPLSIGSLAAKRDKETVNSMQSHTPDTTKAKGRKHVFPAQVGKALDPVPKKRKISEANTTPVRPIEEIEPPTPEAARHISINITGNPMSLKLPQRRDSCAEQANAQNPRQAKVRSDIIVAIPDDTSSYSIVGSSPTPVSQGEEKSAQEDHRRSEGILEKIQTAPDKSKNSDILGPAELENPVGTRNLPTCPAPNSSEQLPRKSLVEAKHRPAVPDVNEPRFQTAPNGTQKATQNSLLSLEAQGCHPIDAQVPSNQQLGSETRSIWKKVHNPSSIFPSAHEMHTEPDSTPLDHSRSQQVTQESGTQYYSATSGGSDRRQNTEPAVHPKTHAFARKIMQRAYSQSGPRQGGHQMDSDQTTGDGHSRDSDTPLNEKEESMDLWQKAINQAQSGLADTMHGVTSSILRRIQPKDAAIESIIHEYKRNGRRIATKLLQRQKRESDSAMASYDRVFHQLENVYDLASRDITTIKESLALQCTGILDVGRVRESTLQKDREALRLAREQLPM